jgi:hypothetical protein
MSVYLSNTNLLRLQSLRRETDGALITGATVTVTIRDLANVQLAGVSWPQIMIDLGAGNYELSLAPTVSWVDDAEYVATIDATTPVGVGHWEYSFLANKRTAS